MDNISQIQNDVSISLGKINNAMECMGNMKEIYESNESNKITIIVIWIGVMCGMVAMGALATYLADQVQHFVERATSYITVGAILCLGAWSSVMGYRRSKRLGGVIACAYAAILSCYLGYVLLDFGAQEPHIAAIGFNIATILQTIAILLTSYALCSRAK